MTGNSYHKLHWGSWAMAIVFIFIAILSPFGLVFWTFWGLEVAACISALYFQRKKYKAKREAIELKWKEELNEIQRKWDEIMNKHL